MNGCTESLLSEWHQWLHTAEQNDDDGALTKVSNTYENLQTETNTDRLLKKMMNHFEGKV